MNKIADIYFHISYFFFFIAQTNVLAFATDICTSSLPNLSVFSLFLLMVSQWSCVANIWNIKTKRFWLQTIIGHKQEKNKIMIRKHRVSWKQNKWSKTLCVRTQQKHKIFSIPYRNNHLCLVNSQIKNKNKTIYLIFFLSSIRFVNSIWSMYDWFCRQFAFKNVRLDRKRYDCLRYICQQHKKKPNDWIGHVDSIVCYWFVYVLKCFQFAQVAYTADCLTDRRQR